MPAMLLIELFSPLSGCCVSFLAARKNDCGGSDSSLPAFSMHPDKRSILETVMDADVKALDRKLFSGFVVTRSCVPVYFHHVCFLFNCSRVKLTCVHSVV